MPAGAVPRPGSCPCPAKRHPPPRATDRIDFARYLATLNAEHRLRTQACDHAEIGRLIDRLA